MYDWSCNIGFNNFILKWNSTLPSTAWPQLLYDPASYLSRCNSLVKYNISHHRNLTEYQQQCVCASPWLLCWHPCTESQCTYCTVGERDFNLMWLQEIASQSVPHVTKFATQCYGSLFCPRLPERLYKLENQKVLRTLHISCLSCCVNSLVSLWNLLLVVQAGQWQKVDKEILRQNVWVITHSRFSSLPAIHLCTPTYADISTVKPKKIICHIILWSWTLIACSKPIWLAWACQV